MGGKAVNAEPQALAVADSLSALSVAIYKEVHKQGNVFLSPFCLAAALSLVELGAKADSAKALHSVLGASSASEHRAGLKSLAARVCGSGEPVTEHGFTLVPHLLRIANSLWLAEDYQLESDYLKLAKSLYGASVESIDVKDPAGSAKTVNDWIEEATGGKIKDMLSEGSIHDLTRLILVNAIYFKGRWRDPFQESATKPAAFYVDGEKKVDVPTMSRASYFEPYEDNEVTVVEMPYCSVSPNSEIAMTLIVPKKRNGLSAVEASLSKGKLEGWMGKLNASARVNVHLPKWRTESTQEFTEELKAMGLDLLFGPKADLSGVSREEGLHISGVLHRTFVEVDENGTEAAAAMVMMVAGSSMPLKPIDLHADRPFLYLIRDQSTGTILFMGRLTDPR